jgi:hypothetical protein
VILLRRVNRKPSLLRPGPAETIRFPGLRPEPLIAQLRYCRTCSGQSKNKGHCTQRLPVLPALQRFHKSKLFGQINCSCRCLARGVSFYFCTVTRRQSYNENCIRFVFTRGSSKGD